MNNNRIETLKKNGVDTSRYFTLVVNETIPAGTKINISIEGNEELVQKIIEDGYVKNTRLHRRFVAAQYMRMLENELGWHGYLNAYYGYMYQFDMMLEEIRVLKELEKRDAATFNERKQFFTPTVVEAILEDYRRDMIKYVEGLPKKKCKRRPYVTVKGIGNVFVDDIPERVYAPIQEAIARCSGNTSYAELYLNLSMFKLNMIKLPYYTKKSKNWVDAFQKEGAFYTLKNLIMFHEVKLVYGGGMYQTKEASMNALNDIVRGYAGYQMNAMLKATIEGNNFNFRASVEAHN